MTGILSAKVISIKPFVECYKIYLEGKMFIMEARDVYKRQLHCITNLIVIYMYIYQHVKNFFFFISKYIDTGMYNLFGIYITFSYSLHLKMSVQALIILGGVSIPDKCRHFFFFSFL